MSNKYPGGIITSGANAGYSVFFDGTGDYLTGTTGTATQFSGNFTVEAWIYVPALPSAATATVIFASQTTHANATGIMFGPYGNTGAIGVFTNNAWTTYSSNPITANAWWHVALVRSGTTVSIYTNGTLTGSFTSSQNYSDGGIRIGTSRAANNDFSGYISNLRVNNSTALYTANFTPPTQLLANSGITLLTCNSPAIVDQSSNAITLTPTGTPTVSTFTPFTGTQLVPNPNTLANTQGVWTISQAAYWMSQNKWPMPPSYPLQSLRFNSADSTSLTRTPSSAGDQKKWTWSGWVKAPPVGTSGVILSGTGGGGSVTWFRFNSSSQLDFVNYDGASFLGNTQTNAVFRDVSAWYHVVCAFDSANATAADRVKIYINGVLQTMTGTVVTLNSNSYINTTGAQYMGREARSAADFVSCYMSNITFVDGQALTPSSFGANDPNTGVWSPVPYSGTYGTNGFRLSFQDNTGTTATTLGKDYSGNGNNWTPNNFSVAAGSGNDSLTDTPTNWGIDYGNGGEVRGNYATLNPLKIFSANFNFSNGNLDVTDSGATNVSAIATMSLPTSGKWYFEATAVAQPSSGALAVGVTNEATATGTSAATFAGAYRSNGVIYNLANVTQTSGATYVANDIIGIAVDVGAGTVKFYKNGVGQGDTPSYSFTAGTVVYPFVAGDNVIGAKSWSMNFGQRPFAYPAPPGFKCLCTTNLPIPTVGATSTTQANDYFNTVLWTGNGTSQTITGVGFQPDLTWFKRRSVAGDHALYDVIRGGNKSLGSNTITAEITELFTIGFNSDGYSLPTGDNQVNGSGITYVGWSWKAGGTGVSNTAGSISSTVSANTTAGFSVVTYTGNGTDNATVGHGLGASPGMIIVKNRTGAWGWFVAQKALSSGNNLQLNTTDTATSALSRGRISTYSSTTFTLTAGSSGTGSFENVNQNTNNYVAYCFAEIAGFSKFGSYTGNGSTDGPFVYCGFRPRYVMIKRTDVANDWGIFDTARNTYNLTDLKLWANSANAENSTIWTVSENNIDILSNGFKVRVTNAGINASGGTYIFAAFAESPFNYSRAR